MKKGVIVLLCFLFSGLSMRSNAQATELAQLALNIEKLAQFKQILSDLKKGYEILTGGYKTIKDISEGNFKLHKVFLDGLMEVSPAVKKYKRVADIIDYQLQLVKEYKSAFNRFKQSDQFRVDEIDYLSKVYGNLFDHSLKNLDDLFTVITKSDLRMNDEERLSAIDKIYEDMQDKLAFLRSFNSSAKLLALQRAKESGDVKVLESLHRQD
ncbi:MAG: TerB family tellurite resistance protein [Terrimonas sp.]|nr:TerB family tellurite resistance protein [Terrimonas sp.]OJY92227.1 MAG: hypothetical protein BGP13_08460 [Sphingobacteriales bacterium 40-81]